uniref:FAM21/CAPZIP domain-containing protein n=1 Tax=Stomoxys calcitrans TaxID=35570 RepID=A0A1I8PNJ1_STOCA
MDTDINESLNLDTILKQATGWTFAGDFQLLQWMNKISQDLESRASNTSKNLAKLNNDVKYTLAKLDNVTNSLTAMSYGNQFVECRVQDDDEITMAHGHSGQSNGVNAEKSASKETIAKFIDNNLKLLRNWHEKYSLDIYDSDEDDDNANLEKTLIFQPVNPYNERPLPHIFGSKEWHANGHVGLSCEDKENCYSGDELSEEFSETSSSIEEEENESYETNSECTSNFSVGNDAINPAIVNTNVKNIVAPLSTESSSTHSSAISNEARNSDLLHTRLLNTPGRASIESSSNSSAANLTTSNLQARSGNDSMQVKPKITGNIPPYRDLFGEPPDDIESTPSSTISRNPINLFDDDDDDDYGVFNSISVNKKNDPVFVPSPLTNTENTGTGLENPEDENIKSTSNQKTSSSRTIKPALLEELEDRLFNVSSPVKPVANDEKNNGPPSSIKQKTRPNLFDEEDDDDDFLSAFVKTQKLRETEKSFEPHLSSFDSKAKAGETSNKAKAINENQENKSDKEKRTELAPKNMHRKGNENRSQQPTLNILSKVNLFDDEDDEDEYNLFAPKTQTAKVNKEGELVRNKNIIVEPNDDKSSKKDERDTLQSSRGVYKDLFEDDGNALEDKNKTRGSEKDAANSQTTIQPDISQIVPLPLQRNLFQSNEVADVKANPGETMPQEEKTNSPLSMPNRSVTKANIPLPSQRNLTNLFDDVENVPAKTETKTEEEKRTPKSYMPENTTHSTKFPLPLQRKSIEDAEQLENATKVSTRFVNKSEINSNLNEKSAQQDVTVCDEDETQYSIFSVDVNVSLQDKKEPANEDKILSVIPDVIRSNLEAKDNSVQAETLPEFDDTTNMPHDTLESSSSDKALASSKYDFNSSLIFDEPPDDDEFFENLGKSTQISNTKFSGFDLENDLYPEPDLPITPPTTTEKPAVDYTGLHIFSDVPPDDNNYEDSIPPKTDFTKHLNSVFYDDFNETLLAIDRNRDAQKDSVSAENMSQEALLESSKSKSLLNDPTEFSKGFIAGKTGSVKRPISKLQLPNLKINVQALLPSKPGKSVPYNAVQKQLDSNVVEQPSSIQNPKVNDTVRTPETEHILQNVNKNRVRAPANRRPSTRKARQENYRKSLLMEEQLSHNPANDVKPGNNTEENLQEKQEYKKSNVTFLATNATQNQTGHLDVNKSKFGANKNILPGKGNEEPIIGDKSRPIVESLISVEHDFLKSVSTNVASNLSQTKVSPRHDTPKTQIPDNTSNKSTFDQRQSDSLSLNKEIKINEDKNIKEFNSTTEKSRVITKSFDAFLSDESEDDDLFGNISSRAMPIQKPPLQTHSGGKIDTSKNDTPSLTSIGSSNKKLSKPETNLDELASKIIPNNPTAKPVADVRHPPQPKRNPNESIEKDKENSKTIFGNSSSESDDDLFANLGAITAKHTKMDVPKTMPLPKVPPKSQAVVNKKNSSLFSDDSDDDDFLKPSAKLLVPKKESKAQTHHTGSIFGDSDSDGDDLFKTKDKVKKTPPSIAAPTKQTTSKAAPMTDNPLADLL